MALQQLADQRGVQVRPEAPQVQAKPEAALAAQKREAPQAAQRRFVQPHSALEQVRL